MRIKYNGIIEEAKKVDVMETVLLINTSTGTTIFNTDSDTKKLSDSLLINGYADLSSYERS